MPVSTGAANAGVRPNKVGELDCNGLSPASASELNTNCDLNSGAGCVLPPKGPGNFYPYWTQARVAGACVWEFGNMRNGNTFGGDAQYGSVGPGTIGAFAGPIRPNPNCY
jgi:hypothetical protein